MLTGLVSRPLAELDPRVLDLLRLGAYQLIDLRVPSHAAVDTTVDLTRAIVGTGASGLVNAVLRKVAAGGDREQWLDRARRRTATERLALATNHPRWIVDAWRDALGGDDELEAALLADDAAPEVHLVARRIDRDELVDGVRRRAGPWSPFAVRLHGGDPGRLRVRALRRRRGAGRGQPAGRAAARPRPAGGPGRAPGWTCAPGPAASPGCWPPSAPTACG